MYYIQVHNVKCGGTIIIYYPRYQKVKFVTTVYKKNTSTVLNLYKLSANTRPQPNVCIQARQIDINEFYFDNEEYR